MKRVYPPKENTGLAFGIDAFDPLVGDDCPDIQAWQPGALALNWPEYCSECNADTRGLYYSSEDSPDYWEARVCAECLRLVWISRIYWPRWEEENDTVPLPSQKGKRDGHD